MPKKKLKDIHTVEPNGRPTEVKVGYKTILIQDTLVGQERCNTTWHEILHAVVYIAGLNQANGPLKEDDAEELVVNQISNFMMGVYRDNPWLLDMLKKHLDEIDH
jgi:hypothetical protein